MKQTASFRNDMIGGLSTFLTMAYIIFVQPAVLSACGMDFGAVMTATCLSSAFATLMMGITTDLPIALAPAMGHNFYFAYTVSLGMGLPWQTVLAANFFSGSVLMFTTAFRWREALVNAVPSSLKSAIAAGIGLLIALVGLKWAGIVVEKPGTFVGLGDLKEPATLLALFGLTLTSILFARGITGAILLGILATLGLGTTWGLIRFEGFLGPIPSLKPTFLKFDLRSLLNPQLIGVIFTLFFLDIFDTVGTLIGVGQAGGFMKEGKLPRAGRALFTDATATVVGTLLGTSTVTSYIESTVGIAQGARTGRANYLTAACFLLALFFHPLVKMVGGGVCTPAGEILYPVVAPALILVGAIIMRVVREISWDDYTEAIPAFLAMVMMPLTFSITEGIAFGFVSHVVLKVLSGRGREVHPLLALIAILFLTGYFFLL